jgi:hypothetical protein
MLAEVLYKTGLLEQTIPHLAKSPLRAAAIILVFALDV